MRIFFHMNTNIYIKRRKLILLLALPPLFLCALIAALMTLVNFRDLHEQGGFHIALGGAAAAVALGVLVFFITYSVTERAVKRGARFTFIEVFGNTLTFSRYAGAYLSLDGLVLYRRLYILPLASLKAIGYDEKRGTIFIETDGEKIREYSDRSERLNYRFVEGNVEFESWWYNESGFTTRSELKIPPLFSDPQVLCARIASAKRAVENLPAPRAYVHKEPEFIKRKKAQEKWKNFLKE